MKNKKETAEKEAQETENQEVKQDKGKEVSLPENKISDLQKELQGGNEKISEKEIKNMVEKMKAMEDDYTDDSSDSDDSDDSDDDDSGADESINTSDNTDASSAVDTVTTIASILISGFYVGDWEKMDKYDIPVSAKKKISAKIAEHYGEKFKLSPEISLFMLVSACYLPVAIRAIKDKAEAKRIKQASEIFSKNERGGTINEAISELKLSKSKAPEHVKQRIQELEKQAETSGRGRPSKEQQKAKKELKELKKEFNIK